MTCCSPIVRNSGSSTVGTGIEGPNAPSEWSAHRTCTKNVSPLFVATTFFLHISHSPLLVVKRTIECWQTIQLLVEQFKSAGIDSGELKSINYRVERFAGQFPDSDQERTFGKHFRDNVQWNVVGVTGRIVFRTGAGQFDRIANYHCGSRQSAHIAFLLSTRQVLTCRMNEMQNQT